MEPDRKEIMKGQKKKKKKRMKGKKVNGWMTELSK